MKPFIGGLVALIAAVLVAFVPFLANAPKEIEGISVKGICIAIIAGLLTGMGSVGFHILRNREPNFMTMSLIIMTGGIAANMISNRILIGEPITGNKVVAIGFAILTAIFANRT